MIKKFLPIFLLLAFTFVFSRYTLASGFNLNSIGNLDVDGKLSSHWWYTATNPTFSGEAQANSTININIDGTDTSTNAGSDGSWSYASTLDEGDHDVSFENNGSKINFILTLGENNVDWDTVDNESTATALPNAGNTLPSAVLIGLGSISFLIGRKFLYRA
jgi:hypothetical protein